MPNRFLLLQLGIDEVLVFNHTSLADGGLPHAAKVCAWAALLCNP